MKIIVPKVLTFDRELRLVLNSFHEFLQWEKELHLEEMFSVERGSDQIAPVLNPDSKPFPGLDGNVKHLGLVVVKAQQGPGQNQMPGTGNRQKLRQPLDHAHDDGFQQQCNIQQILQG